MKTYLWSFIKGAVIGASMSIPGISGGTTAILLRIYDDLIKAVGSFFKNMKRNFLFLITVALGGVLGVWLLSKPLLSLLEMWPQPVTYLFLGVVAGSLPMLLKQARVKKLTSSVILYPLIGAAIMVGLWFMPTGLIQLTVTGWEAYLVLGIVGFFTAAALILPGISFTYILMILGLYEAVLGAVSTLNFSILLPLGLGVIVGTLVITKILEVCMRAHPQGTYLIIIGFVVSSIVLQLFDKEVGWPQGGDIVLCIGTFLIGAALVLLLSVDWRSVKPRSTRDNGNRR